jgi:hypothetical protein
VCELGPPRQRCSVSVDAETMDDMTDDEFEVEVGGEEAVAGSGGRWERVSERRPP